MWQQFRAAHGKRVVRELVAEGLIDASNADECEEALHLVCLMATHGGGHYSDPRHMLRVRRLVPRFGTFTELPYPFAAEGNDFVLLYGHAG
jgi:hypothetical protein